MMIIDVEMIGEVQTISADLGVVQPNIIIENDDVLKELSMFSSLIKSWRHKVAENIPHYQVIRDSILRLSSESLVSGTLLQLIGYK